MAHPSHWEHPDYKKLVYIVAIGMNMQLNHGNILLKDMTVISKLLQKVQIHLWLHTGKDTQLWKGFLNIINIYIVMLMHL